jgi:hypothetical protein
MKRYFSLLGVMLLATGQVWSQRSVDLPRGTAIQVRLTERITSENNRTGDRFRAILDEDIRDRDSLLARRGDEVTGELVQVVRGNREKGHVIEMTLTELRSGNNTYRLDTNNVIVRTQEEEGGRNDDATIIGGGAGIGAVIGAIAGGLKGAIIGAAVGAGAGATAVLITGGDKVEFEPEQKFRFYLDRDVSMRVLAPGATSGELPRSDDRTSVGTTDDRYSDSRQDDRYRDDTRYGTNSYNRENVRQIASELERRSDHAWGMIRDANRYLDDGRRYTGAEADDAMRLYLAVSNFANSAKHFQQFASEDRYRDYLRGAAESLIRQAEQIDSLLRSVNTFGHLQDDWREVQNNLSRLAGNFNLAYVPATSQFRTE